MPWQVACGRQVGACVVWHVCMCVWWRRWWCAVEVCKSGGSAEEGKCVKVSVFSSCHSPAPCPAPRATRARAPPSPPVWLAWRFRETMPTCLAKACSALSTVPSVPVLSHPPSMPPACGVHVPSCPTHLGWGCWETGNVNYHTRHNRACCQSSFPPRVNKMEGWMTLSR